MIFHETILLLMHNKKKLHSLFIAIFCHSRLEMRVLKYIIIYYDDIFLFCRGQLRIKRHGVVSDCRTYGEVKTAQVQEAVSVSVYMVAVSN